jgi:hypothetical protein
MYRNKVLVAIDPITIRMNKAQGYSLGVNTVRNQAIDVGRVIASFGVILTHIAPGDDYSNFVSEVFVFCRVPFFYLITSLFFVQQVEKSASDLTLLSKQASRIIIPFISWTFIYSSLIAAKKLLQGEMIEFNVVGVFIYGQSAVHLYFLMVIFVMQTCIVNSKNIFMKRSVMLNLFSLLTCASISIVGYNKNFTGWKELPNIILLVLAGVWIAKNDLLKSILIQNRVGIRLKLIAGFLGGTVWVTIVYFTFTRGPATLSGINLTLVSGAIAYLFFLCSFSINIKSKTVLYLFGSSYGVYLSHFLILEVCEFCMESLAIKPPIYSWRQEIFFACIVFLLAQFFVMSMRRIKITRRMLLGETDGRC